MLGIIWSIRIIVVIPCVNQVINYSSTFNQSIKFILSLND